MEKKLGSLFDGIGDCEKNEKKGGRRCTYIRIT